MDLKALRDYGNWIGSTASQVYWSVKAVGGWQQVFPGALPRWASRVRQYFNLNPMTLTLLDLKDSKPYVGRAFTALDAAAAEVVRKLTNRDPRISDEMGTIKALSGD